MLHFIKFIISLLLIFSAGNILIGQQVIEDIGHYSQIGLPIAALGISIAKGDKDGTIQLLKSFAVETVLVLGLKRGVNRTRPNGRPYSFPSGHTAISFMSSTYLWKRYGWEYGIPSTVVAAFVGYSRFGLEERVHYFSDVVAGIVIGAGSSWIFTKKREQQIKLDVIGDLSYLGLNLKVNLN